MARGRRERLTAEDGMRAVELARDSVRKYVRHGKRVDPGSMRDAFYIRAGTVVRLETADGRKQLRGCAAEPDRPTSLLGDVDHLGRAIVDASVRAASNSSRGEVQPSELSNLCVSVFYIGAVEESPDPETDIEVGTHGVAIEGRENSAWMFPTMPIEHDWTPIEYLDRTASKAGLSRGAWEEEDVTVLKLGGQLFAEQTPGGRIKKLLEEESPS